MPSLLYYPYWNIYPFFHLNTHVIPYWSISLFFTVIREDRDLVEAITLPFTDPSTQYFVTGFDGFPAFGFRAGTNIKHPFRLFLPERMYRVFSVGVLFIALHTVSQITMHFYFYDFIDFQWYLVRGFSFVCIWSVISITFLNVFHEFYVNVLLLGSNKIICSQSYTYNPLVSKIGNTAIVLNWFLKS